MKKILVFLIAVTFLVPMAVVACHCCPSMSAPVSSEVSLSGVDSMACCFMMTLVKECAPKIEKFLQNSQTFLKDLLSSAQSELVSVFSLPSVERESISPGERNFLSAQPPRYLALSILRV